MYCIWIAIWSNTIRGKSTLLFYLSLSLFIPYAWRHLQITSVDTSAQIWKWRGSFHPLKSHLCDSWAGWHGIWPICEMPYLIQQQQQFWKVLFYSPTAAQQYAGMFSCLYFCHEDRWAHVVTAQTNGFHWPPPIKIDPLIQTSFNKEHFLIHAIVCQANVQWLMCNSQRRLKAHWHSWRLKG